MHQESQTELSSWEKGQFQTTGSISAEQEPEPASLDTSLTRLLLLSFPVCTELSGKLQLSSTEGGKMGFTCVLCQRVLNGDEILQGLGHFAAGDRQVSRVQEVPDPVVILEERLRRLETRAQV